MSDAPARSGPRRLTLALIISAAILATLMGGLIAFELNQRQALVERQQQRVDSITAPAFLLDREYLRFVSALREWTLQPPTPAATESLRLRLDILFSKVAVLRNSHGSQVLLDEPSAAKALAALEASLAEADLVINAPRPEPTAVRALLSRFDGLSVQSQDMGNRADLIASRLLESQTEALLRQNTQIIALSVLQLAVFGAALGGLLWRQRRQHREQQNLREINHDLQAANVEAERSNRGKTVFLANMSHELRTPFNGIMGWLDVLDQSPLQAEQRQWVATIRSSADHLLQLLNDILDMSALEAGKIAMRFAAVDVVTLLREVEALMHPAAKAKGLNLQLSMDLPKQLWITADATRLRQVVINLTNNAIKFTQQGGVRIHARQSPESLGNNGMPTLLVDVCDTGVGISEADLQHLFQRFHQVQEELNRRYAGAGLGLQISLSLARLMGGDIQVASQQGQGSTFTLRLPIQAAQAPAVPAAVVEPAKMPQLRVLVAEDNIVNQQFMRAVLGRLNCEVVTCENGLQALEAQQNGDFDLILMDVHMPEMDGLDATRQIRALPAPKNATPIYALTADVFEETRDNALAAGVDRVLTKPLKLAALRETLGELPRG